jgi:thiamine pyrophosphokinase
MNKCVIITSYIEGNLIDLIGDFNPDFILCADGGYDHAEAAGIKPDMLIGDLDSITVPNDPAIQTLIFPSEKDDTDTGICLQTALDKGFRDILIIGGLGGRLDHTMSNIQLITGKCHLADCISIRDKSNSCTVITNGSITLPCIKNQYVSIFSMSEKSTGVTTSGLKYPLTDAVMVYGSTLGTSNEIIDDQATISVKDGRLLVITSMEGQK